MRREFSSLEEPVADKILVVGHLLQCCVCEATVREARWEEEAVFALCLFLAWVHNDINDINDANVGVTEQRNYGTYHAPLLAVQ